MKLDNQEKYLSKNRISQYLVNNFYNDLGTFLTEINPQTVYEIGCGDGFSTERLVKVLPNARYRAGEIDAEMAQHARERNPTIEIELASIYQIPLEDASVDLALALEVMEHLEDPEQALKELFRVTQRWVIVSVPREPLWRVMNMCRLKYLKFLGNTPGHIQHWSTNGLTRLLSRYGTIRQIKTPVPWSIVLLEKRQQ